jgi:hypothetical protein
VLLPKDGKRSSSQLRQLALMMITHDVNENMTTGTIMIAYFFIFGRRADVTYFEMKSATLVIKKAKSVIVK